MKSLEKYCYKEVEEKEAKCLTQCDMCKDYDTMNAELEDLHEKISGYFPIEDAFSFFTKDIESEMENESKKSENPSSFKDGVKWILDKIKNMGLESLKEFKIIDKDLE